MFDIFFGNIQVGFCGNENITFVFAFIHIIETLARTININRYIDIFPYALKDLISKLSVKNFPLKSIGLVLKFVAFNRMKYPEAAWSS